MIKYAREAAAAESEMQEKCERCKSFLHRPGVAGQQGGISNRRTSLELKEIFFATKME